MSATVAFREHDRSSNRVSRSPAVMLHARLWPCVSSTSGMSAIKTGITVKAAEERRRRDENDVQRPSTIHDLPDDFVAQPLSVVEAGECIQERRDLGRERCQVGPEDTIWPMHSCENTALYSYTGLKSANPWANLASFSVCCGCSPTPRGHPTLTAGCRSSSSCFVMCCRSGAKKTNWMVQEDGSALKRINHLGVSQSKNA